MQNLNIGLINHILYSKGLFSMQSLTDVGYMQAYLFLIIAILHWLLPLINPSSLLGTVRDFHIFTCTGRRLYVHT